MLEVHTENNKLTHFNPVSYSCKNRFDLRCKLKDGFNMKYNNIWVKTANVQSWR